MNKKKPFLAVTLICTILILLFSMSLKVNAKNSPTAEIIGVGEKYKIELSAVKNTKWTSADKKVASVDSSGTVTRIKRGTTTIKAATGKSIVKYKIIVYNKRLNYRAIDINIGDSKQLKYCGTYKKIVWSSADKRIATVNSKGVVNALSTGTVKISALVDGREYSCTVHTAYSSTTLDTVVTCDIQETDTSIILTFKNTMNDYFSVLYTLTFKDFYDATLSLKKISIPMAPNETAEVIYEKPKAFYTYTYNQTPASCITFDSTLAKQFSVESIQVIPPVSGNQGATYLTIKNNSAKDFNLIQFRVILYKDGKRLGGYELVGADLYSNSSKEMYAGFTDITNYAGFDSYIIMPTYAKEYLKKSAPSAMGADFSA